MFSDYFWEVSGLDSTFYDLENEIMDGTHGKTAQQLRRWVRAGWPKRVSKLTGDRTLECRL